MSAVVWALEDPDEHDSLMAEVELLQCSYTEEELEWQQEQEPTSGPTLLLRCRPRTAADASRQFVRADLGWTVGRRYPAEAPTLFVGSDDDANDYDGDARKRHQH